MRFDHTGGATPRYILNVYRPTNYDLHYFHYLKDARAMLERLRTVETQSGTILSVYDLDKDIRKEFVRI